jgi:hypothetical protein
MFWCVYISHEHLMVGGGPTSIGSCNYEQKKLTLKLKISGICNMGGFLLNRLLTKIRHIAC